MHHEDGVTDPGIGFPSFMAFRSAACERRRRLRGQFAVDPAHIAKLESAQRERHTDTQIHRERERERK